MKKYIVGIGIFLIIAINVLTAQAEQVKENKGPDRFETIVADELTNVKYVRVSVIKDTKTSKEYIVFKYKTGSNSGKNIVVLETTKVEKAEEIEEYGKDEY